MSKTWNTERYGVIGRGLAGWHAAARNVSSSGGTLEGYLTEAAEGALVYDADEADADAFTRLVLSGPMVAPELAPGTVQRFAEHSTAAQMCGPGGLTGAFKTLAGMALAGFSSLDRVACDVYAAWLATVPGIRLGYVRDGRVEWQ